MLVIAQKAADHWRGVRLVGLKRVKMFKAISVDEVWEVGVPPVKGANNQQNDSYGGYHETEGNKAHSSFSHAYWCMYYYSASLLITTS